MARQARHGAYCAVFWQVGMMILLLPHIAYCEEVFYCWQEGSTFKCVLIHYPDRLPGETWGGTRYEVQPEESLPAPPSDAYYGPNDYPDPNGVDLDHNGVADCEWTAVASTHWRQPEHSECQLFGAPAGTCGRDHDHGGLDFSANEGDRVRSVMVGIVTEVGYSSANGNFIRIVHPNGTEATYIHLMESAYKNTYQWVYPGDTIGRAGCTGACVPPNYHLHLQIKAPWGTTIDPHMLMYHGC